MVENSTRYNQQLMVPHLAYFLGVTLLVCSVVAVVGNVLAVLIMGRICWKGNAKFSTIIFLNIAVVNLVRCFGFDSYKRTVLAGRYLK